MNPELQRQLARRCSGWQLFTSLGGLTLLFVLAAVWPKGDVGQHLASTSSFSLFVLLAIVAPGLTYDAMAAELRERTWDWQRLSAQSAAQLVLGKLVGSTSLVWLVSLAAFAPFSLELVRQHADPVWLQHACFLAAWSLFLQSLTLLTALEGLAMEGRLATGGGYVLAALLAPFPLLAMSAILDLSRKGETFRYYGHTMELGPFLVLSAVAHFLCTLYAARERMRVQLLEQVGPTAWLLFVALQMLWLGGLQVKVPLPIPPVAVVGCIALLHVWAAMFTGLRSLHALRACLHALRQGRLRSAYLHCPSWLALLVLALLTSLVAGVVLWAGDEPPWLLALACQAPLVTLRDLLVLLALQLVARVPAGSASVTYLLTMHAFLPLLGWALRLDLLRSAASLWPGAEPAESVALIATQILVAAVWVAKSYRRKFADLPLTQDLARDGSVSVASARRRR